MVRDEAQRRERNRLAAAAYRERERLLYAFLSQRTKDAWQTIQQLFESMDHRYHAVMNPVGTEQKLLELHERRELCDAERALVRIQFENAMKISPSLHELIKPLPQTRLNLNRYHVDQLQLAAPIAADITRCQELVDQACEELASFDPSPGARTQFAQVYGWNVQVWNSGASEVSAQASLAVDWDVEMSVMKTWEILLSPTRSKEILLDLPNDGEIRVCILIAPFEVYSKGINIVVLPGPAADIGRSGGGATPRSATTGDMSSVPRAARVRVCALSSPHWLQFCDRHEVSSGNGARWIQLSNGAAWPRTARMDFHSESRPILTSSLDCSGAELL